MPSSVDIPWAVVEISHQAEDSPWLEFQLTNSGHEGWEVLQEYPKTIWRLYLPKTSDLELRFQSLKDQLAPWTNEVTEVAEIRDEDWSENWKAFYHPLLVGRSLLICPSWEKPSPDLSAGRQLIRLDPGSAFGTGYHESTRLCLEHLERLSDSGQLANRAILDYGTGSGILSIGALLLGASQAFAVDRDPLSVLIARENLGVNGFEAPQAEVSQAEYPQPSETFGPYPVVVANLTADILVGLAPRLRAVVGRHLVLGGIVEKRQQKVLDAFTGLRGKLENTLQENDWVSFHFTFQGESES